MEKGSHNNLYYLYRLTALLLLASCRGEGAVPPSPTAPPEATLPTPPGLVIPEIPRLSSNEVTVGQSISFQSESPAPEFIADFNTIAAYGKTMGWPVLPTQFIIVSQLENYDPEITTEGTMENPEGWQYVVKIAYDERAIPFTQKFFQAWLFAAEYEEEIIAPLAEASAYASYNSTWINFLAKCEHCDERLEKTYQTLLNNLASFGPPLIPNLPLPPPILTTPVSPSA